MNYRLQDLIKLIIPGLYVVAFVMGWQFLTANNSLDFSRIKDITSIIVLLVPFVGFVVGYFLECVMFALEHLFYFIGGRRPSKTLLDDGLHGFYILNVKKEILTKHKVSGSITNEKANEILQIAKQSVDREKVEVFRLNSMLARNIFGGQLFLTVLYCFASNCFYKDYLFYILMAVSLLFLLYWFHHNHIYVKYVLAEYGKILKSAKMAK